MKKQTLLALTLAGAVSAPAPVLSSPYLGSSSMPSFDGLERAGAAPSNEPVAPGPDAVEPPDPTDLFLVLMRSEKHLAAAHGALRALATTALETREAPRVPPGGPAEGDPVFFTDDRYAYSRMLRRAGELQGHLHMARHDLVAASRLLAALRPSDPDELRELTGIHGWAVQLTVRFHGVVGLAAMRGIACDPHEGLGSGRDAASAWLLEPGEFPELPLPARPAGSAHLAPTPRDLADLLRARELDLEGIAQLRSLLAAYAALEVPPTREQVERARSWLWNLAASHLRFVARTRGFDVLLPPGEALPEDLLARDRHLREVYEAELATLEGLGVSYLRHDPRADDGREPDSWHRIEVFVGSGEAFMRGLLEEQPPGPGAE